MKRTLIFALLILSLTFVYAQSFDEALGEVYDEGSLQIVNDNYYWVTDAQTFDSEEATDWVAFAAALFLYGQAGWDTTSDSDFQEMLDYSEGVGAYWYDDEGDHLLTIDMTDILDEYETEDYHDMEFSDLYGAIYDYVNAYGDFYSN